MSEVKSLAKQLAESAIAKHVENIVEAKDPGEYDYEGDMAKSQLKSIITNAQRLHDMLEDNTNLPEWVQSKITLAEDYVVTAANYCEGNLDEEVEQIDEGGRIHTRDGKTIKTLSFREMPLRFYNTDDPDKPSPSSKQIETALAKRNPHLSPEHIRAIRQSNAESGKYGKHFVSHSDNPVPKAEIRQALGIREEVEQVDEADVKSKPVLHKGKEIGETGIDNEASPGVGKWYAKHHKSGMNTAGFDSRKEAESEVRAAHGLDEETEGSVPTTPKEKELAAHHGDKTKITYGDVIKARLKSAAAKKMGK